jgi:inner membrane transporter RhtA
MLISRAFRSWIIVTAPPAFKSRPLVISLAALLVAMVSVQAGAAIAKGLFPAVGVAGATALRLVLASILLFIVWRPWRMRPNGREARNIVIYGIATGCMNFCFYSALSRIPLGIAVALEFTGPLGLAMATSHRAIDFLWIATAALGLAALLPTGLGSAHLSGAGIAFALAAGFFWALYIVFGRRAGTARGGAAVAIGTAVGALVVTPLGIAHAGAALIAPSILPAAFGVAVLSSALPYSLEMFAMTRLPTRTFGVLLAGEPAFGALSGWCLLGETLTWVQWAAIASIMVATAGSAVSSRSALQPAPLQE